MSRPLSSIRVPVPRGQSAGQFFGGMPGQVEEYYRAGLEAYAGLDEQERDTFVPLALERIQTGVERYGFSPEPFVEAVGISPAKASSAFVAVVLTGLVIGSGEGTSAEDFLDAAAEKGLINEGNRKATRELAERLESRRSEIETQLARLSLLHSGLPLLNTVEANLDFRVNTDSSFGPLVTPVIEIYLSTGRNDPSDHRFQVSGNQLDSLIRDLTEIRDALRESDEVVEALSGVLLEEE